MPPGELWALIKHLPADSTLATAARAASEKAAAVAEEADLRGRAERAREHREKRWEALGHG